MADDELKIYLRNAHAVIARSRDILISIWRADVEVADVRRTKAAHVEVVRDHPRYGALDRHHSFLINDLH
jgi:hypothetical protein